MALALEGLFQGERRCYHALIALTVSLLHIWELKGFYMFLSWTYTVSQARQGQCDCLSSQKLQYQNLLHMFRPSLGLGLGLVERLDAAIFSELKSLTLLSTTFQDPYSL